MLNNKGHIVIIKNPVATPLNTSIELIVFPANGMAINIKGIYNSGIYTFPNIIFNWFSFAWNITSGIAANIKAIGLNHPGIVLKSSIIPIIKAIIAVITIPIISWNPVKKNRINSLKTKHANKIGPPGLGILGLFGLCLSLTNFPFNVRYLIKIGVIIREIKNDIDVVIIVTIMNSIWVGRYNLILFLYIIYIYITQSIICLGYYFIDQNFITNLTNLYLIYLILLFVIQKI